MSLKSRPGGPAKTSVYLLYTGGTIGMRAMDPGNPASPLVPAGKADLLKYLPALGEQEGIHWDIGYLTDESGRILNPIDSSDVTTEHWLHMAAALARVYHQYDGFVILHGTDTMAYTASALSFLLENLAKPVVLTGAQLPVSFPRTDAVMNLANAIYVAGYQAVGLPLIPEVTICFGDRLLRGNRTRKVSTRAWQGFASPNHPDLASIGEQIRVNPSAVHLPPGGPTAGFRVGRRLVPEVMDVSLFPGLRPERLEALLFLPGLRGVILRTYGAGNAPGNQAFLDVVGRAVSAGRIIVNVTQCAEGAVRMGQYAASSSLLEKGVVSGLDLTPEAALVKLMWLLAERTPDEVRREMQLDQRGEQSENQFEVSLGPVGAAADPRESFRVAIPWPERFRPTGLRRAVVRVSGAGFPGVEPGHEAGLRVFLSRPEGPPGPERGEKQPAGEFRQPYTGPEQAEIIGDVTAAFRGLVTDRRPRDLTLVPGPGYCFWATGLTLTLVTRA